MSSKRKSFLAIQAMSVTRLLSALVLLAQVPQLYAEPEPDVAPALPGPAIAMVVADDCLGAEPNNIRLALASCNKSGVDWVDLTVMRKDDRTLIVKQSSSKSFLTLEDVLASAYTFKLLLKVSPELLDDVLAAVYAAKAAERVVIEPVIQRPQGSLAPVAIAEGVRYWRVPQLKPRPMMVHVLEVDMQKSKMEFVVKSDTSLPAGFEATAEKLSDSVRRLGLTVAINGSYFRPFNGGHLINKAYVPAIGQAVEVDGVLMDAGKLVSSYESSDPRSNAAVCIQGKTLNILPGHCPERTEIAVGAGPLLMQNGVLQTLAEQNVDYYNQPQPRTALAIDKPHKKLWMVVVDGRQKNYSEGITLPELSLLLKDMGASSAINMDGGGSTTMVTMAHGETTTMNSPIHTGIPGRERPVGSILGLRVKP